MSIRSKIIHLLPERIRKLRELRTADFFIVSYPKCGRTWLRMMIGKGLSVNYALGLESSQLSEIQYFHQYQEGIPKIVVSHDDDPHLKPIKNRSVSKSMYSGKNIVLLVRNPKDVITSLYYHYTNFPYQNQFIETIHKGKSLDEFVMDERLGLKSIIDFYNAWASFYKNNESNVMILRYEDLVQNPSTEMTKVYEFMGQILTRDAQEQAVAFGKRENLSSLESKGVLNPKRFATEGKIAKVRAKGSYAKFGNNTLSYVKNCYDNLEELYNYSVE